MLNNVFKVCFIMKMKFIAHCCGQHRLTMLFHSKKCPLSDRPIPVSDRYCEAKIKEITHFICAVGDPTFAPVTIAPAMISPTTKS